eukprot:jgi/Chrzof1/13343/Cz07g29170.t1
MRAHVRPHAPFHTGAQQLVRSLSTSHLRSGVTHCSHTRGSAWHAQSGLHSLRKLRTAHVRHAAPLDLTPAQQHTFEDLLDQLRDVPPDLLHEIYISRRQAFTADFMFWLAEQERKVLGSHKATLANLASQLVYWQECESWQESQRLLPSLASSVAYQNYQEWRAQNNGAEVGDVVPGVSVEELYKASEREEVKLQQQGGTTSAASSSFNAFASHHTAYAELAAGAMARARARLMGYEDGDDINAAIKVLDALLTGCSCREERATVLPEACTPPGIQVEVRADGAPGFMCSNPTQLLAAVKQKQQEVAASNTSSDQGSGNGFTSTRPSQQQQLLPSREPLAVALQDLAQDIVEYDTHVFQRLSPLERYGGQAPY